MFLLSLKKANLSNSSRTIARPLKLATIAICAGTILSLIFPFGEHSTLTETTTNVYAAAEAPIPANKASKLWDGIFDTIEEEKNDNCSNYYYYYYQDNDSRSSYRIMPVSLHYNTVTLDEGTFDFEQGKTPGCDDDDDDSTPDYEDVLKKRKKKRR